MGTPGDMTITDVRTEWPNTDLDTEPEVSLGGCPGCGKPLIGKQSYCSDACRKRLKYHADKAEASPGAIPPDEVISSGAGQTPRPQPKAPRPKPSPKSSAKRQEVSEMLGGFWSLMAAFVVPMASPAMARGMSFTAPIAGPVLDDAVAGTPLDKLVLQRFAGTGRKIAGAKDLLTIPMLLLVAEQRPAMLMSPVFEKYFRRAVRDQLSSVVIAMRKEQDLEAELNQAATDLGMKDDPDADILDTICRQLLGPLLEG